MPHESAYISNEEEIPLDYVKLWLVGFLNISQPTITFAQSLSDRANSRYRWRALIALSVALTRWLIACFFNRIISPLYVYNDPYLTLFRDNVSVRT